MRVHREAAAGLHAGEAGDARLPQALLQADVVAEFGEIVVPPGDRRDAEFGFHASRAPTRLLASVNADALLLAAFALLGARLIPCERADLGHADIPPGVARRPGEGVGDDGDDRRAVGGLSPIHRRPELGEAGDMPRQRRPSTARASRSRLANGHLHLGNPQSGC